MRKALFLALLLACSPVLARDMNPPPWDAGLPNQTHQAWEFTAVTFPHQPYLPVIDNNPYGQPQILTQTVTYPDIVPGPDGYDIPTLHIDEPGGLTIWIPNNPDENLEKLIFWQVTSDKSPTPNGTGPTVTTPGGSTGTNLPAPYPIYQWSGTWYTYNGLIRVVPNPEGEWITFDFLPSTNIEEIVIDTVCIVPEPATMALLALGALPAIMRKRRK